LYSGSTSAKWITPLVVPFRFAGTGQELQFRVYSVPDSKQVSEANQRGYVANLTYEGVASGHGCFISRPLHSVCLCPLVVTQLYFLYQITQPIFIIL
jgi:hypothetical protein